MENAAGRSCNKIDGLKIIICINSIETIDNDRPRLIKRQVDITVKEKQTKIH